MYQPQVVICDMDATKTAFVTSNGVEDDEDTNLPPEWVVVTARRVVPNPACAEERERIELTIEQQVASVPPEQQDAAREMLEDQAVYREPEFVVQELEFHLSPEFTNVLQERLGVTDWPEV